MSQVSDTIPSNSRGEAGPIGFTEIGVSGFKSFAEETRIKLGGLTILAGTNSSGKSSIMQPFLMMKQTLEATYDPGALLLDGPNVSFTSGDQFITKLGASYLPLNHLTIFMYLDKTSLKSQFNWSPQNGISIQSQLYKDIELDVSISLEPDMTPAEILNSAIVYHHDFLPDTLQVVRERCFLRVKGSMDYILGNLQFVGLLRSIIHVQGVRGNPERIYKTAAVRGSMFTGRFENYVASVIDRFQKENPKKLLQLQEILQKLGLTDTIQSQRLNDTQIELRVGRVFGHSDSTDTVNIADVGFGVSQVLPVVVALVVAQPGQMVYIEQPEIHLHPRAQIALAEIFAEAASCGVRIVVETHSELFLLGVQTLVAEDKLDSNLVKLHWFTRNPDGSSKVTLAELDETGAFGDWPEDFGATALGLENRYLSAAESKLWHSVNHSHV